MERYQQLLNFIIIDILQIEQQHYSDQEIITPPITPIINSSFNKQPMSWELIHSCLLHPCDRGSTDNIYLHGSLCYDIRILIFNFYYT